MYLTGRVAAEIEDHVIDHSDFVGQQGRAIFAFLTLERSRPVSRSELASVLWPGETPAGYENAINAVVSKLRAVLIRGGLTSPVITSASGCYDLHLPASTWVDFEAALDAIHDAESALRRNDSAGAYGPSAVAHHIARRPFLAGDESSWAESQREKLHDVLIRALECRSQVYVWNREYALAVEAAKEAVRLEPFRETAHQLLMRAHASAGNTAEALKAYERCRALIADELGADPSPATQALHLKLLQGTHYR